MDKDILDILLGPLDGLKASKSTKLDLCGKISLSTYTVSLYS